MIKCYIVQLDYAIQFLVFGVLVVDRSQRHITMCVGVLGRLPSLELVVPRLQGISNRSSVGQHLSVPIGVSLPEVILVPVPDVVAGGHGAVPPAEPVAAIIGGVMAKIIGIGIRALAIDNIGSISVHDRGLDIGRRGIGISFHNITGIESMVLIPPGTARI